MDEEKFEKETERKREKRTWNEAGKTEEESKDDGGMKEKREKLGEGVLGMSSVVSGSHVGLFNTNQLWTSMTVRL